MNHTSKSHVTQKALSLPYSALTILRIVFIYPSLPYRNFLNHTLLQNCRFSVLPSRFCPRAFVLRANVALP